MTKTKAELALENKIMRRWLVAIINGARKVCLCPDGQERWEDLTEEIPTEEECKMLGLRGLKKWEVSR